MTAALIARTVMLGVAVACLLALLLGNAPQSVDGTKPQVAIVGAGIGGAATAHFLRQYLGEEVAIHVYERVHVGGRLLNMEFEGSRVELGGSMIFEDNFHVRTLADEMGLERVDPGSGPEADSSPFALYDGKEFVFNQSDWTAVTLLRMYLRYGTAPLRFKAQPSAMFDRFRKIYDLQANGTTFETPEQLLKRVGLYHLTQQSFDSHLQGALGTDDSSRRFAAEFLGSVNRVNYNQRNSINAMAGMVSTLPAMDSRIFKIKGGNDLLPKRLLEAADVHMKYGWAVNEVRAAKHRRYELHAVRVPGVEHHQKKSKWDQEVTGPYEAVVIASPLEHSKLRFKGVHVHEPPQRDYQPVTTTYVTGQLRASYFGVESLPTDQVLVTEHADTPFGVISPQRRLASGLTLYKVFSQQPLKGHLLHDLFHNATKVGEQDWYAYPKFSPPERFSPFLLAPGITYNNAWENAASAMEMSVIAAKNSALLVRQHMADVPPEPFDAGSDLDILAAGDARDAAAAAA